jgi:hypothetical protein
VAIRLLPLCGDSQEILILGEQEPAELRGPEEQWFVIELCRPILLARQDVDLPAPKTVGDRDRDMHVHVHGESHGQGVLGDRRFRSSARESVCLRRAASTASAETRMSSTSRS